MDYVDMTVTYILSSKFPTNLNHGISFTITILQHIICMGAPVYIGRQNRIYIYMYMYIHSLPLSKNAKYIHSLINFPQEPLVVYRK